jgi:hypothetical protein
MTFGWLTEQGPSQAIAESQVGTYPVLILREEFKLILMEYPRWDFRLPD